MTFLVYRMESSDSGWGPVTGSYVDCYEKQGFIKGKKFLDELSDYHFSRGMCPGISLGIS
jgi:hypothetical protein